MTRSICALLRAVRHCPALPTRKNFSALYERSRKPFWSSWLRRLSNEEAWIAR